MSTFARIRGAVAIVLVATVVGSAPPSPAATTTIKAVDGSSSGSSKSRTSITLKRPRGSAAGQVMVAGIASYGADQGFSAPAGWKLVREDSVPGVLDQAVYVKAAGPTEPSSYTWGLAHKRRVAGGIATYSGVDTVNPVDGAAAMTASAKGTAVTTPSISPTKAGGLLVQISALNAEGKVKAPSGMTTRWKASSSDRKRGDVLVSAFDGPWADAVATGPRRATATKAGPWIGVLLALRARSATPSPTPGPPPDPAPPPATPPPPPPAPSGDPVLIGAGDIAACADNTGAKATAALLDGLAGTVFTLGDNTYTDGTANEFRDCYQPTWGRHKARTAITVAGNHDYNTAGATGYYGYFGAAAGDPAKGYYDRTMGAWHVVVLNSNCEEVGGCGAGSPQEQWLRGVLAASAATCTVALWHEPAFSSATVHRAFPRYQPFWQTLYDYGADLVLVASDHVYERFGPQTPAGDADPSFGLRQFTVGTGGRSHQLFKTVLPNSEVRDGATFGVMKLTLHPDSYDWQFVPEAGKTFTDSGTAGCHGAPPATTAEPGPIVAVGSSSNSGVGVTSLTLGRPAGTEAGQVMVASVVTSDDRPTISAPEGWAVVRNDAIPGKLRQTLYTKVAGASEPPSYTWNLSTRAQVAGGVSSYAGVDTVQSVDAHDATLNPSAGTNATAPPITTTVAGARLLHFTAVNAEGTLVAPAGMTQRWLAAAPIGATTDALAASFDDTEATAGPTGPRTATATEPGPFIAVLLALRPAP